MKHIPTTLISFVFGSITLFFAGFGLFAIVASLWPAPGTRNELAPWLGVLLGLVFLGLAVICSLPIVMFLKSLEDQQEQSGDDDS